MGKEVPGVEDDFGIRRIGEGGENNLLSVVTNDLLPPHFFVTSRALGRLLDDADGLIVSGEVPSSARILRCHSLCCRLNAAHPHSHIRPFARMKLPPFLLALLPLSPVVAAENPGTLIFQDDFARSESQEKTDEPGNGWGTNSKSRAKGHKQVDLRDGAMYIYLHPEADHAVSVTHPAEFRNGAVALRFMLEDARDSLGLDFADLQCKEVHAGHLFAARVSPKQVLMQDLKTGNMRLDIHTARQAKQKLSAEQQQAIKNTQKTVPLPIKVGQWHDLLVTVAGDQLSVAVDGKVVGSFKSPGFAHPTKRMLRLAVPRNAVVDDVKIWRKE